jgi:hypothetical protein
MPFGEQRAFSARHSECIEALIWLALINVGGSKWTKLIGL